MNREARAELREAAEFSKSHKYHTVHCSPDALLELLDEVDGADLCHAEVSDDLKAATAERDLYASMARLVAETGGKCGAEMVAGPRCCLDIGHERRAHLGRDIDLGTSWSGGELVPSPWADRPAERALWLSILEGKDQ